MLPPVLTYSLVGTCNRTNTSLLFASNVPILPNTPEKYYSYVLTLLTSALIVTKKLLNCENASKLRIYLPNKMIQIFNSALLHSIFLPIVLIDVSEVTKIGYRKKIPKQLSCQNETFVPKIHKNWVWLPNIHLSSAICVF